MCYDVSDNHKLLNRISPQEKKNSSYKDWENGMPNLVGSCKKSDLAVGERDER